MKISVSGPAAAGKSYFVNHLEKIAKEANISLNLNKIPESARIIHKHYPYLASNNIEKFRKFVSYLHIYKEQQYTKNVICDRGVIDNLAFMLLGGKDYEREKEKILSLYASKKLIPYDIILYFDIKVAYSCLLRRALEDPLRKATININSYKQHVIEFKEAFLTVVKDLELEDKLVVIRTKSSRKRYIKRNQDAVKIIKEKIEEKL